MSFFKFSHHFWLSKWRTWSWETNAFNNTRSECSSILCWSLCFATIACPTSVIFGSHFYSLYVVILPTLSGKHYSEYFEVWNYHTSLPFHFLSFTRSFSHGPPVVGKIVQSLLWFIFLGSANTTDQVISWHKSFPPVNIALDSHSKHHP